MTVDVLPPGSRAAAGCIGRATSAPAPGLLVPQRYPRCACGETGVADSLHGSRRDPQCSTRSAPATADALSGTLTRAGRQDHPGGGAGHRAGDHRPRRSPMRCPCTVSSPRSTVNADRHMCNCKMARTFGAPRAAVAVSPRAVASPAQVRVVLAQVARIRPELAAFFGCLYYAALRPEEAVAPTAPSVSSPSRPSWSAWSVGTSATMAPRRTGRLFRGARGGMLSESVYGRIWHAARRAALGPDLAATALARRQRIEDALDAGTGITHSSPRAKASGCTHRRHLPRPCSLYVREPARSPAHGPRKPGPAAAAARH